MGEGNAAQRRRGVGVDELVLHGVAGLRGVPVPRVLRGVLRRELQGAARELVGDPRQRASPDVPQLGLPDPPPDLLRLPLRKECLMCRQIAYLGDPVTLGSLLLDPEYSLRRQSYAPRHQVHGRINADGFGIGWYSPEARAEPARYRKPIPMWNDQTFANIAGAIRTGAFIAAVRNASPGLPINESCTAPYTRGPWLFAHNGGILDWHGPTGLGVALRRRLSDASLAATEGATDSEVLFGLVLDAIAGGAPPAEAIASVMRLTQGMSRGCRLNFLLTDGTTIFGTAAGDTLFTRRDDTSIVLASEPFDDSPAWQVVADDSLVVASLTDLTVGVIP